MSQYKLKICRVTHEKEWLHLWNAKKFTTWDDVRGWLWGNYNATVESILDKSAFYIIFNDENEKVRFSLEWF